MTGPRPPCHFSVCLCGCLPAAVMRTKCTWKRIDLQSMSKHMWLVQEEPAQGQADHRHPEVVGVSLWDARQKGEKGEGGERLVWRYLWQKTDRELLVRSIYNNLEGSIFLFSLDHPGPIINRLQLTAPFPFSILCSIQERLCFSKTYYFPPSLSFRLFILYLTWITSWPKVINPLKLLPVLCSSLGQTLIPGCPQIPMTIPQGGDSLHFADGEREAHPV